MAINVEREKSVAHMEELMPLIRERLAAGQSVNFSPRGISMLPMLRQGRDSVVLSPVMGRLRKYDVPLYQREDGHYVLHRVVAVGRTYTCIGDNQFAYERGIAHEQVIAVMTAFSRDGVLHSTKEWRYGLYCRLWHYSRLPRRVVRALKYRIRRFFSHQK